ncbi:nitroreductase [Chloroflexota bacterium]
MEVIEAIRTRRSIRSFKQDLVPREILEQLLETCLWVPSTSNKQTWEFAILGGELLEELNDKVIEKVKAEWDTSTLTYKNINPDIPYPELFEPYSRRSIDIRNRIDRHHFPPGTPGLEEKRGAYILYGGRYYGAPNVIIIYIDRSLCPQALLDIGIISQTIALAALTYGLGTCLQSMPITWPDIVREHLGLPETKLLAVAIAIGYPDIEAPVNNFERTRDPINVFTHWYGI